PARDTNHLRISAPDRNPGLEPGDDAKLVKVAARAGGSIERQGSPHLGLRGILEASWHDANHGARPEIQVELAAHDGAIGSEPLLPHCVAQDYLAVRARLHFGRRENSAEQRSDAKRGEKPVIADRSGEALGLTIAGAQAERGRSECA